MRTSDNLAHRVREELELLLTPHADKVLRTITAEVPLAQPTLDLLATVKRVYYIQVVDLEPAITNAAELGAVLEYEGLCTQIGRSLQKRGPRLVFVLQGHLPPANELLREMVVFTPAPFRPAGYPGTAAWYEWVDGRWLRP